MSRYKPIGWRNEPHRHSLAAKGISTRYLASKSQKSPMSFSRFLEEVKNPEKEEEEDMNDYYALVNQRQTAERDEYYAGKGMFSGMLSNEAGEREKEMLQQQDVQQMRSMTIKKLTKAVEDGELDPKRREQFVTEKLADLNKKYLDGMYDSQEYRREVKKSLDDFMSVHSKKLKLF